MDVQINIYVITCNISQGMVFNGKQEDLQIIFSYLGKGGYIKRNEKFNLCFNDMITEIAAISPQMFQLRKFLNNNVPNGSYFAVTGRKPTPEENNKLVESLLILNGIVSHEDLRTMDFLYPNYNMYIALGRERSLIGEERDKTKRTCRFCKETYPNTTFDVEAHAISEAFGNKTLICLDECDVCNAEFGRADGIETDIISYFDIDRVMAQVKNKDNNIPKIEFPEYKLSIVDKTINLKFKKQPAKEPSLELLNELKEKEYYINLQNIYRALCKYFISVASDELLTHFGDTISWIKGKKSYIKLPRVAIATSDHIYQQPTITYYIRKAEDHHLPFCIAEFRFAQLIISYIVPFNDSDTCNFLDDGDFYNYWEYMQHYKMLNWNFVDFSDDSKQRYTVKFEYTK